MRSISNLLKRRPGARQAPLGKNQLTIKAGIEADHNDCIIWTGATLVDPSASQTRYGCYGYYDEEQGKRTTTTANRFVLMATAGPPPRPDMQAGHEPVVCGDSLCVNHRHLRWVTPQENVDDMLLDGTSRRKLTDAQVVAIIHDTRAPTVIAAEYGVTQTCISHIKSGHRRRRAWSISGVELPDGARLAA